MYDESACMMLLGGIGYEKFNDFDSCEVKSLNGWLDAIGNTMTENVWLAPLVAVLAGMVTSFTPCSLTSISLLIGYVGGYSENSTKKAFKYSLVFCIGMAITFVILGITASLFGKLIHFEDRWLHIVFGGFMILMAFQAWEIVHIIPEFNAVSSNKKRGYTGAFVTGILGGVFASHCAIPVLIVMLAIAAEKGSLLWGVTLMLFYWLGHSILLMVAGTSIGFVNQMKNSRKYAIFNKIAKFVMGSIILLLGVYLIYSGL